LFTFVKSKNGMDYKQWYKAHFESKLKGRYITLERVMPVLKSYEDFIEISTAGYSELGREIPLIKIGNGEHIVLAWSQMHGNESTTTKALFDFLKFIGQENFFQNEIKQFLDQYSFYILPILNPDGADLYSRENANKVDLNRDAQNLSQSESLTLRAVFNKVQPNLCLNLHDQRSIYGLDTGLAATVSFLAPSANKDRGLTPAREVAMSHIVRLDKMLQKLLPGQIGRYDDSFNANCVGDTFQMAGVPTILFEAGHDKEDYNRDGTRSLIFYAFLELFHFSDEQKTLEDFNHYFNIPQNRLNYNDVILRRVLVKGYDKLVDITIQYSEELVKGKVLFKAIIDNIGPCDMRYGHREVDLDGSSLLINSQENIEVGQNVSKIVLKSDESSIIFLNN
jgi:hypothetical protein